MVNPIHHATINGWHKPSIIGLYGLYKALPHFHIYLSHSNSKKMNLRFFQQQLDLRSSNFQVQYLPLPPLPPLPPVPSRRLRGLATFTAASAINAMGAVATADMAEAAMAATLRGRGSWPWQHHGVLRHSAPLIRFTKFHQVSRVI